MKRNATLLAAILLCTVGTVYAISFGGPGGTWPQSWPKELEPLRKQAWTWEHGCSGDMSYDIPFANREEFEAAWPHILKVKSEGTSITLLRGAHLRVTPAKSAGVQIWTPPAPPKGTGAEVPPGTINRIVLIVDGEIVDLNRIRLPEGTPIIDERFQDEKKK